MELPADFLSLMGEQYGSELSERLVFGLQAEPQVSIRLNPVKASIFAMSPQVGYAVPWCPEAYYLQERPSFTFDPLFHAGVYYVQEAGSMFLAQAIQQCFLPQVEGSHGVVALDLCAAPGGKSTLLRSLLPDDALLVSNEPMRQRAQVLAENMVKWGHSRCVVTQNYPDEFAAFSEAFDLIVADVPCSGEGMFRKDEEAVRDWSLSNVNTCWRRQRDIVSQIWHALRPGGIFVYSTCTFNHYEDEENVRWIAEQTGAEILPIDCVPEWNVTEGTPGYHFFPGTSRGEGFYIAVLRKPGTLEPRHVDACVNSFQKVEERNTRFLLPAEHATLMRRMRRLLRCLVCGVETATLKGKDWVPSHHLAMNPSLLADSYPVYELDYDQAIAYLRREALRIDVPRGIVLVTYQGVPLGFVKGIGNRANNLYPQEWRIRTTYSSSFLVPTGLSKRP